MLLPGMRKTGGEEDYLGARGVREKTYILAYESVVSSSKLSIPGVDTDHKLVTTKAIIFLPGFQGFARAT